MEKDDFFKNYKSYICFQPTNYFKTTLFENEHILLGLNCLEPGQITDKHAHEVQLRFYMVLEGTGHIRVGDMETEAGPGTIIWIPAGHTHTVVNTGSNNLIMLVGMAPAQAE
ncbi:MAG TPA: cupin domain-containing protein [Anaerolineaceae bacterium]|nr:cupin domain-containing protein [Anaerolineaceae bacterium]